jgi:hypothetical protein
MTSGSRVNKIHRLRRGERLKSVNVYRTIVIENVLPCRKDVPQLAQIFIKVPSLNGPYCLAVFASFAW